MQRRPRRRLPVPIGDKQPVGARTPPISAYPLRPYPARPFVPRPHPLYARPSKSLIVVRLGIAFMVVVIATVLATVWVLTKDRTDSGRAEDSQARTTPTNQDSDGASDRTSPLLMEIEARAEAERQQLQSQARQAY